jgi:hypothetical protein
MTRHNFKVGLFALALMTAGCSTPYQETGLMGGVSATQIDSNTFRVMARGNAFTSIDAIQNYALLKSAETTLAAGDDFFIILSADDRSRVNYFTSPGTATSNTSFFGSTATTNTTYTPPTSTPIFKPGQALMIKTFKGQKPANDPSAFDAQEVVKYIGASVRGK